MRALLLASLTACASTAGYTDRTGVSQRPSDIASCEIEACGGTGDAVVIGLGVTLLVGVTIAKLWRAQ